MDHLFMVQCTMLERDLMADLLTEWPHAVRLQRLVSALRGAFRCGAVGLLQLDDDCLRPLAVDGLAQETLGRRFLVGQHPRFAAILASPEPVRFAPGTRLPDPYDGLLESRLGEPLPVHDCMGQSIRLDEKTWGALTLDTLEAALEQENRRLRELLDSSPVLGEEVVVADVIAVDSNPSSRQILINKGSRQHIYVGQPIADAQGVLGQVIQVNPYTSTALLISDARHALPVQVNRTGVRAIAVGAGESDRLLLSFVPTNADIAPGDLVVSSGLDNRFPAGYPVGKVAEVTVVPGEPFSRIVVEPSAQLGRSREVLLVWPQARAPGETAASDATGVAAPLGVP